MLVRPVRILPALAALLLLTAGPVAAGELTFRDVMPDAGTPGGPAALAWNHDGTSLAYLHDDGQGTLPFQTPKSTQAVGRNGLLKDIHPEVGQLRRHLHRRGDIVTTVGIRP